jgi:hypothetical protein
LWPFGLISPCATALTICEAASSWVTSDITGITRPCAIQPMTAIWAMK